jgi:hypothetical protein
MLWSRLATLRRHRPLGRGPRNSRPVWQRAMGCFSIVLYSVLALGIPLPLDATPISGGIFPCMHHRCGCHSAEQCWRDCCCMSMAQKLAWARDNNVTPPDYVLTAAAEDTYGEEPAAKCCCCHAAPAKPCCTTETSSTCCQPPESNTSEKVETKPVQSGIILLSALKCRGMADSWTGAPISLTPPATINRYEMGECIGLVVEWIQKFSTRAISPPTPPPRFHVA